MRMLELASLLQLWFSVADPAIALPNGFEHHSTKLLLTRRTLSTREYDPHSPRQDSRRPLRSYSSFESDDSGYSDYTESFHDRERHHELSPERKASLHLAAQSALGGLGVLGFGTAAGLGIAGHIKKQKCLKAHGPNGNCKGVFHRRDLRGTKAAQAISRRNVPRRRASYSLTGDGGLIRLHKRTEGEERALEKLQTENGRTHINEASESRMGGHGFPKTPTVWDTGQASLSHIGNGRSSAEKTEYHSPNTLGHRLNGRPSTANGGELDGAHQQPNGVHPHTNGVHLHTTSMHQHSGIPNSSPLSTIESGKSHSHHSSRTSSMSMSDGSGSEYTMTTSERARTRAIEHPRYDKMRTRVLDRWKNIRKSPLKLSLIGLGAGAVTTGVVLGAVKATRDRKCREDPNLCMNNPVHQPTMLGVPASLTSQGPQYDRNGTLMPGFEGSPRYTSADFQKQSPGLPNRSTDTKPVAPAPSQQPGVTSWPEPSPNKAAALRGPNPAAPDPAHNSNVAPVPSHTGTVAAGPGNAT